MIRNPCVLIPKRIDEVISKFVKFGKPPPQEDLLVWILSRTELRTGSNNTYTNTYTNANTNTNYFIKKVIMLK